MLIDHQHFNFRAFPVKLEPKEKRVHLVLEDPKVKPDSPVKADKDCLEPLEAKAKPVKWAQRESQELMAVMVQQEMTVILEEMDPPARQELTALTDFR